MKKFLNLIEIDADNVHGIQVKIKVNGIKEVFQPFFGNETTTDKREQLKRALKERNHLFNVFDITAKGILLKEIALCIESEKSNTGFNGICKTYYKDKRKDESVEIEVIGICLRNLINGKVANNKLTVHLFPSEKAAIKEAKEIRNKNIRNYNKIVSVYNERIMLKAKNLAHREFMVLEPFLHTLKCIDRKIWNDASVKAFPWGLPV